MTDLPLGAQLWIEHGDGAAMAHPVMLDGRARIAPVDGRPQRAIDVRLIGQGERRTVSIGALVAAKALTAAEEAEYQQLDAELAGTIGDGRKLKRFNGLRLRWLMFGELAA